ncbi:M23 family metallopeptidase [Brucepastera parasyntrophica]|uniref:M23 family metallopeptidase n=1 Tax=Brucepastera parasyntrophica TaxID=2880008 RepID=UPI00210BDC5B|nr:M23 family metallopeptidase [Brucepastera parasyntrophica]ULQ60267.1 M23 family metallopeptidase [Brucepastera parasyntrophica]
MKQKMIYSIFFFFICILCGLSAEDNGFKLLTTEEAQNLVRDQSAACNELEHLRSTTELVTTDTDEALFILLPDEMVADIVSYEKNKFSIRMPGNTPVFALCEGSLIKPAYDNIDGIFVPIQSRNIVIYYINLMKSIVPLSTGIEIKEGELIAYSGRTGAVFEHQLGIRIEVAEDSDRDYTIYLITSKSLK